MNDFIFALFQKLGGDVLALPTALILVGNSKLLPTCIRLSKAVNYTHKYIT
jgi:hypothetical protein